MLTLLSISFTNSEKENITMNRSEFIKWLDEKSGLTRESDNSDSYWKELMNYADYIYDELEVDEDKAIFKWERMYWGGSEWERNEYSFDEFVEKYETYSLK